MLAITIGLFEGQRMTMNEAIEEAASNLPDPFTSAADNRALVAWLNQQPDEVRSEFSCTLVQWLMNPPGTESSNCVDTLDVLNTPLETITLAAARALGIPEAGE